MTSKKKSNSQTKVDRKSMKHKLSDDSLDDDTEHSPQISPKTNFLEPKIGKKELINPKVTAKKTRGKSRSYKKTDLPIESSSEILEPKPSMKHKASKAVQDEFKSKLTAKKTGKTSGSNNKDLNLESASKVFKPKSSRKHKSSDSDQDKLSQKITNKKSKKGGSKNDDKIMEPTEVTFSITKDKSLESRKSRVSDEGQLRNKPTNRRLTMRAVDEPEAPVEQLSTKPTGKRKSILKPRPSRKKVTSIESDNMKQTDHTSEKIGISKRTRSQICYPGAEDIVESEDVLYTVCDLSVNAIEDELSRSGSKNTVHEKIQNGRTRKECNEDVETIETEQSESPQKVKSCKYSEKKLSVHGQIEKLNDSVDPVITNNPVVMQSKAGKTKPIIYRLL
jgi:hypothetical protein